MRAKYRDNKKANALDQYQQAFAAMLGRQYAFGFWKGRVALYAILKGLGVGEGDEVIMTGYTCVMAVNPIVYLGAKPVFVDIEPATYNIDPNQIEAKITAKTRLVIAQHTYGYPVDLDAVTDISTRKGGFGRANGCPYDTQAVHLFACEKPSTVGVEHFARGVIGHGGDNGHLMPPSLQSQRQLI